MAEKLLNKSGLAEFSKKIKENAVFIKDEKTSTPAILDLVYPVGSIYMSVNNTSPATFIGGTWTRIQDRFLLGVGSTYTTANNTGGEATHTLTIAEMPSHTHGTYVDTNFRAVFNADFSQDWHQSLVNASLHDTSSGFYSGATGGGGAHNNMPPYYTVYMWKRTA